MTRATARRRAGGGRAAEPAAAAYAHLRGCGDPVLAALIEALGEQRFERSPDRPPPAAHYAALVRAIVGQQLSTHAARAIWARLLEHFSGHPPEPEQILAADPEALRAAAGLSRAKVGFLRSLAEHVSSGELDLDALGGEGDEEIVAVLTRVHGIGVWSAHMFLMFQLERPDVLPVGDLGIRRALERAYALDALPGAAAVEAIAEPWRPHRTVACRYLWLSLANAPT
ncbi:MAG: DNA-3-methyladenine glycosylase 2 family protein [Acidobacteriota bacterium]|nr:DNA-3-methyladenine glycosylase 2 family protein [Acidobacteriota bacterium]